MGVVTLLLGVDDCTYCEVCNGDVIVFTRWKEGR